MTATLAEDLTRPEAFGNLTRTRSVTLAETHISWAFLLDHDVVKVKKPVDLGFLDFTTIEKRRAACEAEVTLNRRLTRDVYRGVVAITREADGHFAVAGSGATVDWAVHMRRLPDERRADVLLAAGQLTDMCIDAVARRLVEFHETAPKDSRFGTPEAIERDVEENFAQAHDALERALGSEEAEEVVRWQRAFVRGHRDLFMERAQRGFIREGHGDLKLEHVYFDSIRDRAAASRRVTILDGIEFNERFRNIDVCADIAFLAMDLEASGRVDLAERFLAEYARQSNDFDLYRLVDFYASYRAFVRGKVAAMVAAQAAAAGDDTVLQAAERDVRRYFRLALASQRRPLVMPSVVAVGGIIASGKSTIAERLAHAMNAPVVEADRTRKAMLGIAPTQPIRETAWRGAYDPAFTERVYAEVLRRAEAVLASGRPVVIDASFRSAQMRENARALAVAANVPFRFVECRAEPNVCRARLALRERGKSVSDGRLAIFDDFTARFEPVHELPPGEHVIVDTDRPLSATIGKLRDNLDTWPAHFVT